MTHVIHVTHVTHVHTRHTRHARHTWHTRYVTHVTHVTYVPSQRRCLSTDDVDGLNVLYPSCGNNAYNFITPPCSYQAYGYMVRRVRPLHLAVACVPVRHVGFITRAMCVRPPSTHITRLSCGRHDGLELPRRSVITV